MSDTETLSILIPVYNEAGSITDSLTRIEAYLRENSHLRQSTIVVVNDGSTDTTERLITQFSGVRYLGYAPNKGKGYALKYAMEQIDSDFVYLCDADLSVSIDQLNDFWERRTEANYIIGSRQHTESNVTVSWYRKYLGIVGNKLINLLLRLNIDDTQCGFKLLDRRAQAIFCTHTTNRWGFDFDVLLRMKQSGATITAVPVTWIAGHDSKMTLWGYVQTLWELGVVWWKVRVSRHT